MFDKIASIATTLLVVAGVTTLVLPGRETQGVVREGGTALSKIINAAIGRG